MTDERDWADAPYVRVYQSIRHDPKFATVYDDDKALAAWLRLLLNADPTYPAPADLPVRLSRYANDVLTTAGILRVTGRTYTLSGLSKERTSRAMTGAERSKAWRDRRNGLVTERDVPSVTERDVVPVTPRAGAGASASVSVVTSLREESPERNPLSDAITYIEDRTRRPWSFGAGSKPWETLVADVRDFTWPVVRGAMEAEKATFPDVAQLVFGASRRLHPIGNVREAEPDPEYVKEQLAERKKRRTNGA